MIRSLRQQAYGMLNGRDGDAETLRKLGYVTSENDEFITAKYYLREDSKCTGIRSDDIVKTPIRDTKQFYIPSEL
jgi:hypothetical protein